MERQWLVNGSGPGIALVDIDPPAEGHVTGFPVRLRQVLLSLEAGQVRCPRSAQR